MSGGDLTRVLTAVGTILLVMVAVFVVERAFQRRGRQIADAVTGGAELDPVIRTRLRFVRRLIEAAIVVIGIATALSQFTALDRFAASVLASGAIAAAVVGFAAQRSLGNVIAGILLAITQPIRIGDQIAFDDFSGVVEDIRLAHTVVQTGVDARVIVPNGKLADSVIRNDSIVSPTVGVEVELWLAHDSDELRALEVIEDVVPDVQASVKKVTFEGTILVVTGPAVPPIERAPKQAELLRSTLHALRSAGLR